MSRFLRALGSLALCLFGGLGLSAQGSTTSLSVLEAGRPKFRAYGVKEGLPHSTIMAITQDREGLLWVGTQDGAACYDGRVWTTVDMPDRQVSNYVHAVLQSKDGAMWFARQEGGVVRLQDGKWTQWTQAQGLPADRVHALLETRDAAGRPTLWAATFGGGVAKWDGKAWSAVDLPLKSRRLWKLAPVPGHPDSLWVGGEDGTLVRVTPQGAMAMEGLPKVSVNQIYQRTASDGVEEVWVSTYGAGVGRCREGRWTFYGQAQGMPDSYCTDVAETVSRRGERVLWVTTHGGLAFLEEGSDRFQAFSFRSGLPTETLYRLYVQPSPEGPFTLWVGSSGAGLLAYREGGWRSHDAFSGLLGSVAWCVVEARFGGKDQILAAASRGIHAFDGQRWRVWPVPERLKNLRVNALMARTPAKGDSELWVGALGALARYRNGSWRFYGPEDGLNASAVSALAFTEDAEGPRIWAGTVKGLSCLKGDRWESVGDAQGLQDVTIDSLLDGGRREGGTELWVGTRGSGLWRLHRGTFTRFTREQGHLPNNLVTHVALVPRPGGARELWVATNGGGVTVMDPDRPEQPGWTLSTRTPLALPSDSVQALAASPDGSLWMSTHQGVVRLTRAGPSGPGDLAMELFTEDDGLPSVNATPHAILIDHRGRIWVGTRGGLGTVDPSRLPVDASRPSLVIRRITINGQPRPGAEHLDLLTLRPGESRVGFAYALLAFHGEQAIRYRTRLVGIEEAPTDWTVSGEREFAGLAPGAYRLEVWARDGRGQVTGPRAFSVKMLPSFWQQGSVQVGALALLVIAVAAALQARERLHRSHQEALRAEVAERTADLTILNADLNREVHERRAAERAKDEFTALVSHELRTPLTAVKGALGLLQAHAVALPEVRRRELIQMASRNTDRLLHLVNDLLDIKRIESGALHLSPQELEVEALLAEALAANAPYAQPLGVTLALEGDLAGLRVVADPLRVGQVLANLLSNGAKFSQRGTEVKLGAELAGDEVRIWVRNEGEPIPEAFRDRVFLKFAQAETGTTRGVKGTGLGLAISKALVEAMDGRIGFESAEGGTTFWFTLPEASCLA